MCDTCAHVIERGLKEKKWMGTVRSRPGVLGLILATVNVD